MKALSMKPWLASILVAQLAAGPAWGRGVDLAPASVAGSGKKRVLALSVALDDIAQKSLGSIDYLAEQSIERSSRFRLLRLADELDRNNAELREVRLKAAESHWSLGMRAYDELDTQKAAKDFNEAVRAFKQADLTRHFSALSKAWVMRVATLLANGETRAANIEIDKILAVDARAVFSPDYFPPDTLKLVEDARQNTRVRSTMGLEVKTSPAGAQVYVNGQFRGASPLRLQNLPPGDHWLNIVAPGYAMVQQLAVPGLNEFSLKAAEGQGRWKSAVEKVASNFDGPGRDEAAVNLGKWLNADQVLLTLVRAAPKTNRLQLVVLRIDCEDGHNWAYSVATVSSSDGLRTEVDALLSEALTTDVPRKEGSPVSHFDQVGKARRRGPGPGFSRQTLAWTLVGTASALLIGGVVTGNLAANQNAQFKAQPQQSAEAANIKASGQGFALTADLLFLGAVLAGAPGGYLFWQESENSSPPGTSEGLAQTEIPRP